MVALLARLIRPITAPQLVKHRPGGGLAEREPHRSVSQRMVSEDGDEGDGGERRRPTLTLATGPRRGTSPIRNRVPPGTLPQA